jgi:antibiotic biosynthesis monooxygenase (ABM) superfamily enzyme
MKVKILAKIIVPEDMNEKVKPVLDKLVTMITKQPGYVFAEILQRRGVPTEWMLMTMWASFNDWKCWLESGERNEMIKKRDYLKEASIEVYDYAK